MSRFLQVSGPGGRKNGQIVGNIEEKSPDFFFEVGVAAGRGREEIPKRGKRGFGEGFLQAFFDTQGQAESHVRSQVLVIPRL